nr:putative integron gene cassette protein [uncultured bacterium]
MQRPLKSQRILRASPMIATGTHTAHEAVSFGMMRSMPITTRAVTPTPMQSRQEVSKLPSSRRSRIAMILVAA